MRTGFVFFFGLVVAGCGSTDAIVHEENTGDPPTITSFFVAYEMPIVEFFEGNENPTFQVYFNDPKTPFTSDIKFTYDLESHVLKTVSCIEHEMCEGLREMFAPYQLRKIFKNIFLSDSATTPYFVLFFDDTTTVPSPDFGIFYNQITSEFESVCYYDADGNLYRYDPSIRMVYQFDYNILRK